MKLDNYLVEFFKRKPNDINTEKEIEWLIQNINHNYLILLKKVAKSRDSKNFLKFVFGINSKFFNKDKEIIMFNNIQKKHGVEADFLIRNDYKQKFNMFIDSIYKKRIGVEPIKLCIECEEMGHDYNNYNYIFPIGRIFNYFFSWSMNQFFEDYSPGIQLHIATLMGMKTPTEIAKWDNDVWEDYPPLESLLEDGKHNWNDLISSISKNPFNAVAYVQSDRFVIYDTKKYEQMIYVLYNKLRMK